MVATAGSTGATVWEVATGRVRRHFDGTRSPIFRLQFAPDGRTLLTVTETAVLLWALAD
jgi:hypothetical protein